MTGKPQRLNPYGDKRRSDPLSPRQERYRRQMGHELPAECSEGHRLRPGPWGLQICDVCTNIALSKIKLSRRPI